MKVLLGVTFALLLVALGFAYVQRTPSNQSTLLMRIDSLEKENEELSDEVTRLDAKVEVLMPLLRSGASIRPPARAVDDDAAARADQLAREEVERSRRALEASEKERMKREREAAMALEESKMLARERELEAKPDVRVRERLLNSNAIGRIKSWRKEYGLAGISVIGDPGLKSGDVLSIRRGKKNIGRVEVKQVNIDGVMAEIFPPYKPGMVMPDFQVGDEVIYAPQR